MAALDNPTIEYLAAKTHFWEAAADAVTRLVTLAEDLMKPPTTPSPFDALTPEALDALSIAESAELLASQYGCDKHNSGSDCSCP